VRLDHGISQLSIRLTKRNRAFNFSGRIQNTNLTWAEAGAVLRVIDCLIFLWDYRLDARNFKSFPAPAVRFDSISVIAPATFPLAKPLCLRPSPWVAA
jgi:hypothetical protein